jgi:hypothetical protein
MVWLTSLGAACYEGFAESCSFFLLKQDQTILGAVVGFAAMVHAVWRFECVGASVVTSALI